MAEDLSILTTAMIDRQLASFLESGLAIHVGTRDAQLQPWGARASAARVEDDGLHVLVFLPTLATPRLIANLEANGQVAVVFCRPNDDRCCQVKGILVQARPAASEDESFVATQWTALGQRLQDIGIPAAGISGWQVWPATAIRLKLTALFDATPGPHAGAPLP